MPLVLGLNSAHPDSSAALVSDKGVIAAIAEERLNRKKHCAVFPHLAIQEVLRIAGATMADVTDVAVARDPRANLTSKLGFIARNPKVGLNLAMLRFGVQRETAHSTETLASESAVREGLSRARAHNVEHHLAHIASSFFWSGFDRATGISVDGSGDWCSVMFARCEGTNIRVLKRCHPPHSLGIFYTTVCGFLGFNRYGEEYKVMGLAAYGEDAYADEMKSLVRWDPRRGVVINTRAITTYSHVQSRDERLFDTSGKGEIIVPKMWGEPMERMFGPPRKRGEPLTDRDRNIAASLQRRFEDVYMQMIRDAVEKTGIRDAAMAGGCALNGVANGRVLGEGLLDRLYIHPAAGDDGTATGAAMYVLHCKLGVPRLPKIATAYWGPDRSEETIRDDLAESGLPHERLDPAALIERTADALSQGKIVGWFQGREEWGPRALGNRSILCHPGWPDMKAILNARIKNREPFRPFAPAILSDRLSDCFEGQHEVPFMNIVYKVRPEWRERLSATTHEDNTGRVQTVERDQNPMYYDLISAFERRTGVPVLLNTSFNENEPIVNTPAQAIACFARTKMDCLAIGPFWLEKSQDLAAEAKVIGDGP